MGRAVKAESMDFQAGSTFIVNFCWYECVLDMAVQTVLLMIGFR